MPIQKTQSSLISAVTDQPLLLAQGSETMFSAYLQELASDDEFLGCYEASRSNAMQEPDDEYWDGDDAFVAAYRPYNVVNGVLQIPVFGVLLNRFSYQFGRRATGYTYVEKAYNRGMDDDNVKAIALVIDSPGGEVAGNFELVEGMVARRDEKPVRAFASDHAYSAAYSIASAASQIIMTRSGGVGSVGVVVAHAEQSQALASEGIRITFIYAGKHKVEGNQYEKLSDSAKARIQNKVDRIYGEFTALVAANRGMEESAVRGTEALTYDSSDAVQVGFADRVGALETEMAVFTEEADGQEREFMTTTKTSIAPAATQASQSDITQEQMDAAVSTAVSEGASAEKARINMILDSDVGKARPRAALGAALKTDLSADQATAFLATLPEEKAPEVAAPAAAAPTPAPAAANTGFNAAMANSENPNVGAQPEGTPSAGLTEKVSAEQMLAALSMSIGKPRKQQATN